MKNIFEKERIKCQMFKDIHNQKKNKKNKTCCLKTEEKYLNIY